MLIKLTVSQTRPQPLISLWPLFYYGVKGAKGHVIDAARIILRRKGWSLAKLPLCAFLPLHSSSVGGPDSHEQRYQRRIHITNSTMHHPSLVQMYIV